MNIDESTLMMVLGVASITASAMFFALHASARHIAGVRLWALGCLSVGFAVLLDAPRLVENWQWASLLFNIPLSAGQALFLVGTAHFVSRPAKKHTLSLLVVIVVLLTVVFTLLLPSSGLRIFTLSTFQACVNGYTAWLLWRYREPQSSRSYWVASAVVLAQAAAALAQGLLVLTSSVTVTYAAPELPFANIVTWVGAMANALIGNWILFLLVMLRLVSELKAVAAQDSLTGLLNRRGLRSHIDSLLTPTRSVQSLAVLLLDIDHFKTVNDQHGHDVGDKVLAMMGDVMRALGSPHIAPCRWGGEEFCLVVDSYSDKSLVELAEHARREFERTTRSHPDLPCGATVSIGLASMQIDSSFEFSKLVASADAQLYLAKRGGRNRVCSATNGGGRWAPDFVI
ncbi:diguanylate cyclase domain-containing protein [Massilia sp. CMS3.1]|uniref:GGDEF domain-containing protein n=1 Tax=Massilia sp. CMS3.1 TaxID=3373083 RepID=UPI003EE67DCA